MNMEDYRKRLDILIEQSVITKTAYDVAFSAFDELTKILGKSDITQAEMLFTHLPMALTRTNSGEEVEKPNDAIMEEVRASEHFDTAQAQVDFVERKWGKDSLMANDNIYICITQR
ncbi:hypothetical protein JNUCC1_00885 [Lentibacillus sp. JNUCC-1]|nr:hypothetical protein [Lentibacillus sp. JNUCC-1]